MPRPHILGLDCSEGQFKSALLMKRYYSSILGDPGAVSRVDKMFVVKVYCKIETSPWALSSAEASLYCGEAFVLWGGWGERKRERAGHDGKGEERREAPPFPSSHRSPRAFYFCRLLIFWWGYPAGASAEERASGPCEGVKYTPRKLFR